MRCLKLIINLETKKCNLCIRNCNVDRDINLGVCQADNHLKVARAQLHFWEEPCVSGKNGSGTVFFSHCNLKCVFCQNHCISQVYFILNLCAKFSLKSQPSIYGKYGKWIL